MEIWSIDKVYEVINKLKAMGRSSDEQYMMYVLSPYITSMGYDVFDMDEVDMDINTGRMKISVTKDVQLIVALSSYLPSMENDKIFLHVDVKGYSLNLYLNALGSWEKVGQVSINEDDIEGTYPSMMRLMAKDALRRTLHEKGDRLFTEGVLRKQLEEGKFDNRFVMDVLRDEVNNPTDGFIKLIAEGLASKYSTDNVSTIVDGLMPLKDVGVVDILADIVKGKGISKGTVRSVETKEKEVEKKEEPVYKIPEVEEKTATKEVVLQDNPFNIQPDIFQQTNTPHDPFHKEYEEKKDIEPTSEEVTGVDMGTPDLMQLVKNPGKED